MAKKAAAKPEVKPRKPYELRKTPTGREIVFFETLNADPSHNRTTAARTAGFGNPAVAGHRLMTEPSKQWLRELLLAKPRKVDTTFVKTALMQRFAELNDICEFLNTTPKDEIFDQDGPRQNLGPIARICLEPTARCGEANGQPVWSVMYGLASRPAEMKVLTSLGKMICDQPTDTRETDASIIAYLERARKSRAKAESPEEFI